METPAELAVLQEQLVAGLARALCENAPGNLDDAQARDAARQVIQGQALPEDVAGLFGDRPVCTLVGFDADQIQAWVFDSERVQVASGASFVLDGLNQEVDEIVGKHGICGVLYSAGGGGVLFANARADRNALVNETRDWLEKRSHKLTFTVVAEELHAADLAPANGGETLPAAGELALDRFQLVGGLRGALVRLQVKMRDAKDSRPRPSTARVKRKKDEIRAERCPSCGRRPPCKKPVRDASPEYWCNWCRGLRKVYLDRPDVRSKEDDKALTFADLAESVDRRRKYLGFIAIDGNSMGAIVQSVSTLSQLRAFSVATTRIYEDAREKAREVIQLFLKDERETESCLSLLSGGDEITLVLPAAAAPQVAVAALDAIEEGFDRETAPGGLLHEAFKDAPKTLERLRQAGAAAGVITAHANYPVRLLRRYANELQKQAKSDCGPNGHRSAVSWLLLTDSSPLTEALEASPGKDDLGVAAFKRLLREAELAQEHQVAASAFQGILGYCRDEERSIRSLGDGSKEGVVDLLAANFFRYQIARNDALGKWWQAVVAKNEDLSHGDDPLDHIGRWFHRGGRRRLEQIVDLLSLEPFPGKKPAEVTA